MPDITEPAAPETATVGAAREGVLSAASPAGRQDAGETHRGLTFLPLANTSKSSQCSFNCGLSRFSNFSSFPPLAN